MGRGAYTQALANVEPALSFLERLPEGIERQRAELGVRLMEGMTVTALYGLASTERVQTFERVCQLSEPLGDAPALRRLTSTSGQKFLEMFGSSLALLDLRHMT